MFCDLITLRTVVLMLLIVFAEQFLFHPELHLWMSQTSHAIFIWGVRNSSSSLQACCCSWEASPELVFFAMENEVRRSRRKWLNDQSRTQITAASVTRWVPKGDHHSFHLLWNLLSRYSHIFLMVLTKILDTLILPTKISWGNIFSS